MPLLRIITTIILVMLSLSACNSQYEDRIYPKPKHTGLPITDYYHEITFAIFMKTIMSDSYNGKECSMYVTLNRQGKVTDIDNVEGFTPLCEAGMAAVFSAEIPAPPDDKTYASFKRFPVVFQMP
jgi:colicin import membrane protein